MKRLLNFNLVLAVPLVSAHDVTPRWVTPSGYMLTGEAARLEMQEAMNRLPEPQSEPASWFVAAAGNTVPAQAAAFSAFAPAVKTRWDEKFLFIESNGLPAHNMMEGITAWQQQVPLPQRYAGENAWRIPLRPVPAKAPLTVKDRFLRGAIAIAVNGVPIFNPQNNRGEISFDIGELDQWGGHCGRADDYHYHIAPLHLQKMAGAQHPIAYALDGYPIYGLTEPGGSVPKALDACNGHTDAELGYHYHASKTYPFLNGGFHGEVMERDGQVDPQPRATPVRPALQQLRGARITGFTISGDGKVRTLTYLVAGRDGKVRFTDEGNGKWLFNYTSPDGAKTQERHQIREGGGLGGDRSPRRAAGQSSGASTGMDALKKPRAGFVLSSPQIPDPAKLPATFTGDGDGVSPPLAWHGAPAGTRSFALVMDHLTPDGSIKGYWTMWDIPAGTAALPQNVRGIGKTGAGFRGVAGYEPPKSQGPGPKQYVISLYALSAPPVLTKQDAEVTREVLLAAIADRILGSASLAVTYTREQTDGVTERRQR